MSATWEMSCPERCSACSWSTACALSAAHGIPEAAGILLTGGVYLWRRDMLSAVLAGTAFYMVLVNLVFA